ncbi:MAG: GNAT family protein [Planctomycetota bacterium]
MIDEQTIEDGLVLRQFTLDDAEAFYAVVDANRDAIASYMLWARTLASVDEVREMIAGWLEARDRSLGVTLGIYEAGRLVGSVYHVRGCRKHLNVEIGYWLATEARGRGVATRVVRAMFDLTFDELGFHRAYLRIAPQNDASMAIAERLGLEKEGVLRDLWQMAPGEFWDGVIYATTAPRWATQKAGAT